ncbi:hypothetical protein PAJ34TS1_20060 [Paenibacillus azoreducens]|uniref:Uncharacterized protein n=1 Tax=Paenibacillus azoreducens TaxID=116718 RepID=A0A919YG90_9BACL|nr:hypothetical protein J34TS1_26070 [Paenibacillus azoreducens]
MPEQTYVLLYGDYDILNDIFVDSISEIEFHRATEIRKYWRLPRSFGEISYT